MQKKEGISLAVTLEVIVVAMVITVILHVPAQVFGSAVNCNIISAAGGNVGLDSDCDGFPDSLEQTGFTFPGTAAGSIPGFNSATGWSATTLDPSVKDLFVILAPAATGSLFPSDAITILTSAAHNDLGITVHPIAAAQADSYLHVTPVQRAIKITESTVANSSYFGLTEPGWTAVNYPDKTGSKSSLVYTTAIQTYVTANCPASGCYLWNAPTTKMTAAQMVQAIIRHTIAHEAGHQMQLAPIADQALGYHYPACNAVGCTPSILDQSIYVVGGVFYVGEDYTTADLAAVNLLQTYCYLPTTKLQTITSCVSTSNCATSAYECIYP